MESSDLIPLLTSSESPVVGDLPDLDLCISQCSALTVEECLHRLENIFHSAPVGLCFVDLNYRYVTVNRCFARMYQLPIAAFLGRTIREALPHVAEQIMAQLQTCLAAEALIEIELTVERPSNDGSSVDTLIYLRSAQHMLDLANRIVGFSVALMDITERKRAEAALRESEENLRYTVDLNPHIPFTADVHGNITYVSPRFLTLTGLTREQATLEAWVEAIYPDHRANVLDAWLRSMATGRPFDQTYWIRCAGEEWRWVRGRAFPRCDAHGTAIRWYGTLEDIHERKLLDEALSVKTARLEEVTQQLALRVREDHLTGLANRRHFDAALEREAVRALRSKAPLALVMLDVDHFKRFNDAYGHPAGDDCLRSVAHALSTVLRRQGDLAARYGGEEFVLLLPDTSEEGALAVAREANAAVRALGIRHPHSETGFLTISGGVALFRHRPDAALGELSIDLIRRADAALYAAKAKGRNCVLSEESTRNPAGYLPLQRRA